MSLPIRFKYEREVTQEKPLLSASQLSPILLNFYLETLDRVLLFEKFPQLPYARYGIEEKKIFFILSEFNDIFLSQGLVGQITPGAS